MGEPQYEIRVRGRVSSAVLSSFDQLGSEVRRVETVLYGPLVDQAELHAVLERIQGLGLELIEVRRLPSRDDDPADLA